MTFLVLLVRSSAAHSTGEIGWAVVTLLSRGEVEHHADSGAVFSLYPQYGLLSFFAFELNIVPYRNCVVLASYLNTGTATLIKIYSETVNRS